MANRGGEVHGQTRHDQYNPGIATNNQLLLHDHFEPQSWVAIIPDYQVEFESTLLVNSM